MNGILRDIRVLDLSRVYSGPHCALLLADFGADVIKVEQPGPGDDSRSLPPYYHRQPYFFTENNRRKKGVTLNLRTAKGREMLLDLARQSQLLIENFTPGFMESLGLGYSDVREVNSSIIYASISGFGQTGPYRSLMAYDSVVTAMSGLMSLTGFPDQPPAMPNIAIADFTTSLYATISALAAVMHWRDTGQGQHLDISMHDCMWYPVAYLALPRFVAKNEVLRRTGNKSPTFVPANLYRTKDGYVHISVVPNSHWDHLLKAIGREDLIGDARYASLGERHKRVAEIDAMLEEWLGERTAYEAAMHLQACGVPAGAVMEVDQVIADPHLAARNMIAEIDQPGVGTMRIPGSPFKMSETPVEAGGTAPGLGEHNAEVFGELLGLKEEQLADLKQQGII